MPKALYARPTTIRNCRPKVPVFSKVVRHARKRGGNAVAPFDGNWHGKPCQREANARVLDDVDFQLCWRFGVSHSRLGLGVCNPSLASVRCFWLGSITASVLAILLRPSTLGGLASDGIIRGHVQIEAYVPTFHEIPPHLRPDCPPKPLSFKGCCCPLGGRAMRRKKGLQEKL